MPMWSVGRPESGTRSTSRGGGRDGFTLLELIAVLAVVGVALSVAMPSISSGLQRWRLREAVREMSTMVKFARNQAVTRRQSLQVVLDRARNMYWLDRASMAQDVEQAYEKGMRVYELPDGVRFGQVSIGGRDSDDERLGLVFSPYGTTRAATLQIVDLRGRGYQIVLDQATGHTSILRTEN